MISKVKVSSSGIRCWRRTFTLTYTPRFPDALCLLAEITTLSWKSILPEICLLWTTNHLPPLSINNPFATSQRCRSRHARNQWLCIQATSKQSCRTAHPGRITWRPGMWYKVSDKYSRYTHRVTTFCQISIQCTCTEYVAFWKFPTSLTVFCDSIIFMSLEVPTARLTTLKIPSFEMLSALAIMRLIELLFVSPLITRDHGFYIGESFPARKPWLALTCQCLSISSAILTGTLSSKPFWFFEHFPWIFMLKIKFQ